VDIQKFAPVVEIEYAIHILFYVYGKLIVVYDEDIVL
jgi:hypothetical protein